MEKEEDEHRAAERAVGRDHQRPPPHPVGEQPSKRAGDEAPEPEDEEDKPRAGARAGQALHPDREDDPHRPVAERGECLTGDEQAGVAVGEEPAHQAGSRVGRTSAASSAPRGRLRRTGGLTAAAKVAINWPGKRGCHR